MGSKSARHAHREKARRNRRHSSNSAGNGVHADDALVTKSVDQLSLYRGCSTPVEGAAAARAQLEQSLSELVDLVGPYDPWDIIELLRLRSAPPLPGSGREPDHEAIAALVELVALIVASRGPREAPESASSAGARPLASPVIDDVHRIALSCLRSGSHAIAFEAAAASDDVLARIRAGAVLREVSVRNQIYPHMLRDTLRALFGTPEMEAECRAVLGFTVDDAIAVLDACAELRGRVWGERMSTAANTARVAMFLSQTPETGEGGDERVESYRQAARARAREALQAARANPADEVALSDSQLAAYTGRTPDTVSAVLDAFVLSPGAQSPHEAALELLTGASPLRMKPLLRDTDGRVLLVHDVLHLPAIRETFEQRLKDAQRWDAYSKHRGAHLEDTAAELFARHLPGVQVHTGFEYFVPDPLAPAPQTEPGTYTKRTEGDVLLVIDDIAIIIEAKAVALNPRARTGDSWRLRRDLTRIVTDAAAQAERLRERIDTDHGLRLRDGSWLDLAHIREVHTVAVSLEDLSGIATTTAELVRAGLLPAANLPWTVSLHDLRTISELLARPAELILYLRRRTDVETTQKFDAVDELDLFLHFYEGGLYVEPDPVRIARELPQFGPPTVAARRRRTAERATVLASRTDRLDAWYFHQLGHTSTPAGKPAITADATVVALIDEITALARPGWLAIGTALLDGSAKTQHRCGTAAKTLCAQSALDGRPHTITLMGGTNQVNSHVLVWMSVPHPTQHAPALAHLRRYLQAKKHQMQTARAAGLLIDARTGTLTDFLFDNRTPGPDHELDRLAGEMGLESVSAVSRSLPPPKARRSRG
ncbi:hypothetical protein [Streptomyces sp. NPDC055099]